MSAPHRFIPPIYVDLNMPTPSGKESTGAKKLAPEDPASFTSLLQTQNATGRCSTAEPRPSRANSLFLDLLEFPLAGGDTAPDALLKCELDGVLGAAPDVSQTRDPELLEEAAAFPAAVFSTPTISTSRAASTTTTNTMGAQRGGRASQFSAKQRRERHNANERRRTNAAKDRVRDMRDTVTGLERQRQELAASREAQADGVTLPHTRALQDVVPQERVAGDLGAGIPGSASYMELAHAVDALRVEKRHLEEQLDQLDSQNSAIQAVQAELVVSVKKSLKRKRPEHEHDELLGLADSKRAALESFQDEPVPAGGYCVETEAVPAYLRVLFSEPLSSDDAFNWVKDSYGDIMALKAQQQRGDTNGLSSVLGWRQDRCHIEPAADTKDATESKLELMLSQDFSGVVSGELVFNTWSLLTLLEAFKQLFPLAKDLAVLQTVNDDCVVVRLGVAPAHDAPVVHSVVVLARGQIDGGYLISMRSVPLSLGQRAFAADEESYQPVMAWLMLLDSFDAQARPVCEVTLGATLQHKSTRVLRRTATELSMVAVRWQQAVGHGQRRLP